MFSRLIQHLKRLRSSPTRWARRVAAAVTLVAYLVGSAGISISLDGGGSANRPQCKLRGGPCCCPAQAVQSGTCCCHSPASRKKAEDEAPHNKSCCATKQGSSNDKRDRRESPTTDQVSPCPCGPAGGDAASGSSEPRLC
ncbi:MAG: hypothetical protein DWQ29_09290, partial [Planctomycetota bacterium]